MDDYVRRKQQSFLPTVESFSSLESFNLSGEEFLHSKTTKPTSGRKTKTRYGRGRRQTEDELSSPRRQNSSGEDSHRLEILQVNFVNGPGDDLLRDFLQGYANDCFRQASLTLSAGELRRAIDYLNSEFLAAQPWKLDWHGAASIHYKYYSCPREVVACNQLGETGLQAINISNLEDNIEITKPNNDKFVAMGSHTSEALLQNTEPAVEIRFATLNNAKKAAQEAQGLPPQSIRRKMLLEKSRPIVIVLNPTSGTQLGFAVIEEMKQKDYVTAVVSLGKNQTPSDNLKEIQAKLKNPLGTVVDIKVLIVGGDGTANWVLSDFFDGLNEVLNVTGFAVMPLGTGNDMARSLGWGTGVTSKSTISRDCEDYYRMLIELDPELPNTITEMDQWELNVLCTDEGPNPGLGFRKLNDVDVAVILRHLETTGPKSMAEVWSHNLDKISIFQRNFQLYFTIGSDAWVAKEVDETRKNHPECFAWGLGKLIYAWHGLRAIEEMWGKGACKAFRDDTDVKIWARGRRSVAVGETTPSGTGDELGWEKTSLRRQRALLTFEKTRQFGWFNINSYSAGAGINKFGSGKDGCLEFESSRGTTFELALPSVAIQEKPGMREYVVHVPKAEQDQPQEIVLQTDGEPFVLSRRNDLYLHIRERKPKQTFYLGKKFSSCSPQTEAWWSNT